MNPSSLPVSLQAIPGIRAGRRAILIMVAALGMTIGHAAHAAAVDARLLADEANGEHWPSYGRTYREQHFSPLQQITPANVTQLGLVWASDLNTSLRADAQPLEANGVVYTATGLSIVQAFAARTGKRLWRYDPGVGRVAGPKLSPSWGIRGLALWRDRVLVATQDGRLLAVQARTGRLLWSTQTLDSSMDKLGEVTITGAPRVFNDKVVIGSAGAERWARGALSCFDVRTGKRLWRFYTVPGNPADGFENDAMRMAAATWSGEWWRYGGGGTVWNAITYDPELNQLYLGTGNGGPWNWQIRNPAGGDALFLAAIVALNADTGAYLWHYQLNPNEGWDYPAAMDIVLADLKLDGRIHQVLMQAPKNGFYYVIDRRTGKLLSAEKFAKVTWAERIDLRTGRPVENPNIHYDQGPVLIWPGFMGAHNWQPMAYSPITQLAYIPTRESPAVYSVQGVDRSQWQPQRGQWNTGMSYAPVPELQAAAEASFSYLQAWDPVQQRAVWQVRTPSLLNGGAMVTAGGLVFQGHIDGTFNAFDARSGALLWRFAAGVAVMGAPISYAVQGRQYISVLTGPPQVDFPEAAEFGWQYRLHPRRILTFALHGRMPLPPTPPPRLAQPLRLAQVTADPQLAAQGAEPFDQYCSGCHGGGAVATGGAPDLRESAIPVSDAAFAAVVRDGVLQSQGMPRFEHLNALQLSALRHYIRSLAEQDGTVGTLRRGP